MQKVQEGAHSGCDGKGQAQKREGGIYMHQMRRGEEIHTSIVTLQLGKKGLTENFIEEVKRVLKKRKVVRIKILKSAREIPKEEIAKVLSQKTGAKISKIIGYIIILEAESH